MALLDRLLGRPLASSEESEQHIGPVAGVPILGLDALSSSAYGPEAALTVLLPLGAGAAAYVGPISAAIVGLLALVYLSYRQTIAAYPAGGGSYTVAKQNLGVRAGLLAAGALMLDYVLVVAVGISAGVGAIISAFPSLQPWTLPLCLGLLAAITLVNLRGVKESGAALMVPTYAFVLCLGVVLLLGLAKAAAAAGHPVPVVAPPAAAAASMPVSVWLLARAFASGCTAMTGVEAVSNGTPAFRAPVVPNAQKTLTAIVAILIALLAGIAYLASAYGVSATEPGQPGYESMLSGLVGAVVGRGIVYYVTMASVTAVLALSANTGFADFPRMCQIIANDSYLPSAFAERGRRLVFSYGILVIALLAGALLVVFGGVTDRLIPLFAVGAFLAFTLSQAGMVVHWHRSRTRGWRRALVINAVGALATFLTLLVVLVAKFLEGAWISLILVPGLLLCFEGVHRHYRSVGRQLATTEPLYLDRILPPVVIVPVRGWSTLTRKALRFALKLSPDVICVHVTSDGRPGPIVEQWKAMVANPCESAGRAAPRLEVLASPYRQLFGSLLGLIDRAEDENPGRQIAIVIPDLVEHRWYHYLLHNQRAALLRGALQLRADPRVIIVTVPWFLDA